MIRIVGLISMSLVLVACSNTQPYEEPENMDEPQGPGVFTGEAGEFSFGKYFAKRKKRQQEQQQKTAAQGYFPVYSGNLPAMTEENFKEFEAFQAWLRAREKGTPEYNEYLDWKAYQQFRQYRKQQAQPAPAQ